MRQTLSCSIYIKHLLAELCMPTLLKHKPSSLVTINKASYDRERVLPELELQISIFECQAFILYENKDRINLLIYNEKLLDQLLSSEAVRRFLIAQGYELRENLATGLLYNLSARFEQFHSAGFEKKEDCFPHEIGVLLGYPLEDVRDFIDNHGKNYVLSGSWKVYHNTKAALRVFNQYRKLRMTAVEVLQRGGELSEMKAIGK